MSFFRKKIRRFSSQAKSYRRLLREQGGNLKAVRRVRRWRRSDGF